MAVTIGSAFVQIVPSAKGIAGSISNALSGEAENAGQTAGTSIAGKIKGIIATAGIGAAVTKTMKDSLEAGGNLQQSFGGLETLYGDAADAAKSYAYEAAQAGISANDYAEQAVSFGAGLKAAFGGDTKKAVEAANTAIMDMTDNAAKMGTPIESIQNAYQGFAKGQYNMLDNLKLGYGGTKSEMERLLADAQKISGVEYNIDNLGDVYEAIHVIQGELGLTGVAAEEASTTLSGSFGAMKAAATNLLANMALGENIKPQLTALAASTKNFLIGNLLPMIGNIVKSVPTIFKEVFNLAVSAIKGIDWIGAGKSAIEFVKNGITELSEDVPKAIEDIGNSAKEWFESVNWSDAGQTVIGFIKDGIDIRYTDIPNLIMDIAEAAVGFFKLIPWLDAGKAVIGFIESGIRFLIDNIPNAIKGIAERAIGLFKLIPWLDAGKAVIEFISNGITMLLNLIPDVLVSIGDMAVGLFKLIPWLDLGKTIITFIGSGISMLVSHIPDLIVAIGETAVGLFQLIPWRDLGKKVIEFIEKGIDSLVNNIPTAIENIGTTARDWFKEHVPWASGGKLAISRIVDGITEWVNKIPEKIKEIGNTARDWLKDKVSWSSGGKQAIKKIRDGLIEWASKIPDKLAEIAKNAVQAVKDIDWLQLGKDIINGIADGIKSLPGALSGAVVNAAKGALNAAKNALGIKSPSRVFRDEVGLQIAKGIIVGFDSGIDPLADDMVNSINRAKNAVTKNLDVASTYTVNGQAQTLENIPGAISGIVLDGVAQIAESVERGIGNMKMVANNREYGRFIADLGFERAK